MIACIETGVRTRGGWIGDCVGMQGPCNGLAVGLWQGRDVGKVRRELVETRLEPLCACTNVKIPVQTQRGPISGGLRRC